MPLYVLRSSNYKSETLFFLRPASNVSQHKETNSRIGPVKVREKRLLAPPARVSAIRESRPAPFSPLASFMHDWPNERPTTIFRSC